LHIKFLQITKVNKSEAGIQWHNADENVLPKDKQRVLISVNGIYYFTIYDLKMNIFRLRENPKKYFKPDENEICWIDFID
jgi:hypothetical protein